MNIPFRPITIDDKEVITSFTMNSNYQNCDFSFANMCSWQFLYHSEFAIVNNFLLIRFRIEKSNRTAYMMPVGEGDLKEALLLLESDSLALGRPLCMLGITPDARVLLEQVLPRQFVYIPERDYYDYIYLREELAMLKGKKFQPKRNHINQFKKRYAYEYIPITKEIVPQCLQLERQWYASNCSAEEEEALHDERQSLIFSLRHFEQLNLTGGAIRVENQIIAFSWGAPINRNTFGVHIEKADTRYDGAYAIMNQEFAAHLPEHYIYLNREEDLGLEGLRKAKLSYQPTLLLEKAAAIKKPTPNQQCHG